MNNALQRIEVSDENRLMTLVERIVSDPSADPAKLREILSVKQSWEADEARKAFAFAMASFQSNCPIIPKADTANGRAYSRIDRIHRMIRPILQEFGLWFAWTICEEREGGMIYLEGILGHSKGHQVTCKQLISLPEKISGTNSAQRAGSGQTYAKRYGELAALNIITGDDDDGNAGQRKPVKTGQSGEVAALKKQLWDLTAAKHGGSKTTLRQWLTDEFALDPETTLEDLSAAEIKALIEKAKGKI